jgi:hypothetical protein
MWEYFYNDKWIECKLLHEFLMTYQIIYYDEEKKDFIELIVSTDLVRKKIVYAA